ncbi:MAG: PPC domain-containing protein [Deltaproteobacteria bacterium]|nr:PPC domain-containing protein [Deltaproteobacteria bacterium]
MARNGLHGIIVALAFIAAACGGGGSNQQDAGVQEDATGPQFDREQQDQFVQEDAPVNDNNDSFAQAIQMDFTSASQKSGVINPKGDEDFYKFTGQAGTWIGIWVSANTECTEGKLDPVVTLYDSSETQIAENDDEVRGVNCDSFLITRLPSTGTYYAKVRDWFHFYYPSDDTKWQGGPLFTYKIYLLTLEDGVSGTIIDQEPGNDLATAAPLTFPAGAAGSLLGTYANTSDIDVYTFTLTADSTVYYSFQSEGSDGNGSSAKLGDVTITDSAGATIIARIDGAGGALELEPPLVPAGNYALWIKSSGALGANAFYTASFFTGSTDNPVDAEGATASGANDTLANAEPLTESATAGSYFVLSHLPTLGDVDYYKVDLAASTTLAVACGAARNGSGVQGLTVSIRDSGDSEIRAGTETLSENLVVGGSSTSTDPLNISTAGTYYVKLSKTGQAAEVAASWIRCGIHSRPQQ